MLYLLTPTSDLLTQGLMGISGEGATLPTSMQNPPRFRRSGTHQSWLNQSLLFSKLSRPQFPQLPATGGWIQMPWP